MQTRTAESWNHLVEMLFEDSRDTSLDRFRSPFVFRGMARDWPLLPSLLRLGHGDAAIRDIERALMRNFRKYAQAEIEREASEWEWLSIAQHHGLPTRLLDWTFSPFVALHFSTDQEGDFDQDAVVWMVHFMHSRAWLPGRLQDVLRRNFAIGFSAEMLQREFPHISRLEQHKGRDPAFVLFFEPPSLDPRIVNQWGLFSMMNRPTGDLSEWLTRNATADPKLARKIVIPAKLKWEIRDKLDQMNLSERVIYPGLDGLCQWLKRWYRRKPPLPAVATVTAAPTKRRKRAAPRKRVRARKK